MTGCRTATGFARISEGLAAMTGKRISYRELVAE